MGTAKVSATLDPELVTQAKARVGERGFSRYLEEALARRLQHDRFADLEKELSAAHGPIPAEVQRRLDRAPWPRKPSGEARCSWTSDGLSARAVEIVAV